MMYIQMGSTVGCTISNQGGHPIHSENQSSKSLSKLGAALGTCFGSLTIVATVSAAIGGQSPEAGCWRMLSPTAESRP
jgi:hypothetical protein